MQIPESYRYQLNFITLVCDNNLKLDDLNSVNKMAKRH